MAKALDKVKADPVFQAEVEQTAENATTRFSLRWKGAAADAAQACRRMVGSLSKGRRLVSRPSATDEIPAEDTDGPDEVTEDPKAAESIDVWNHRAGETVARLKKSLRGTPATVFRKVDKYSVGFISPLAFQAFLASNEPGISQQLVGCIWRKADLDCDGKVDLHEFGLLFNESITSAPGSSLPSPEGKVKK